MKTIYDPVSGTTFTVSGNLDVMGGFDEDGRRVKDARDGEVLRIDRPARKPVMVEPGQVWLHPALDLHFTVTSVCHYCALDGDSVISVQKLLDDPEWLFVGIVDGGRIPSGVEQFAFGDISRDDLVKAIRAAADRAMVMPVDDLLSLPPLGAAGGPETEQATLLGDPKNLEWGELKPVQLEGEWLGNPPAPKWCAACGQVHNLEKECQR